MTRKEDKKNIYLLGSSSMFNDIGSEMISPILPFFISALGGGGVAIGLISGLREGLSSLLKLVGGWFSDKIGKRKEIIFFGYFASAILKLLIGLAQTAAQVTTFVSLERIGKIRDPPRDAIIAQMRIRKGDGFGLHQMFDSLGGFLGTVFVILIFWLLKWDFRTIVLVAGGITTLSLIPLFFVKDKKVDPINRNMIESIKNLDKKLKKIIYILSIFLLANFGLYMFILLKAKSVSGNEITPFILYAIFGIIYTLGSRPAGKLSDKIGRKRTLFIGYVLFIAVCLGFAFTNTIAGIGVLFGVYGIVFAMTEPVQKAMIADLSGHQKGTAMGYFHFIRGLTVILGGLIAGYIWNIDQNFMFIYLAIIGIIALFSLYGTKKTIHRLLNPQEEITRVGKMTWEKHYK
jgi:MFS family permease